MDVILGALDLLKVPPLIVPPESYVNLKSFSLGDKAEFGALPNWNPICVLGALLKPLVTLLVDDLIYSLIETDAF